MRRVVSEPVKFFAWSQKSGEKKLPFLFFFFFFFSKDFFLRFFLSFFFSLDFFFWLFRWERRMCEEGKCAKKNMSYVFFSFFFAFFFFGASRRRAMVRKLRKGHMKRVRPRGGFGGAVDNSRRGGLRHDFWPRPARASYGFIPPTSPRRVGPLPDDPVHRDCVRLRGTTGFRAVAEEVPPFFSFLFFFFFLCSFSPFFFFFFVKGSRKAAQDWVNNFMVNNFMVKQFMVNNFLCK